MAICLISLQARSSPELFKINGSSPYSKPKNLNISFNCKFKFQDSISFPNRLCRKCSPHSDFSPVGEGFSPEAYQNNGLKKVDNFDALLKEWVKFVKSVLPGGIWWNLCNEGESEESPRPSHKPITVTYALARMWELMADQRWVLYTAFGALTIAAVIPLFNLDYYATVFGVTCL